MSSVAIQARSIHASLGGVPVLHDIDLSLMQGQWISVIGPNGAGKSTLLQVIAGLLPHAGEVLFPLCPEASQLTKRKAQYLAWLGQSEHGAEDLRVYDVVMLGRLPHMDWLAAPSDADHEAVQMALTTTQTWSLRDRNLGQLSGGERQRVLMARTLAVQSSLLLLDEPLVNLDPPHQVNWLRAVRHWVQQGHTVVSVLHDISYALMADEVVVMAHGRVAHQGRCDHPQTHSAIEAVFEQRIRIAQMGELWVALPRLDLF